MTLVSCWRWGSHCRCQLVNWRPLRHLPNLPPLIRQPQACRWCSRCSQAVAESHSVAGKPVSGQMPSIINRMHCQQWSPSFWTSQPQREGACCEALWRIQI